MGGAHHWSAQDCLGKTLVALAYSDKPPLLGLGGRPSFTHWGILTPWLYFSPSLSVPPFLESWVLERLEMQSPSNPPSWITLWKKPVAGGTRGQVRLERSLAALPWSQRLLEGRRSPLAWGLVAVSVWKGYHWAVCS